MYLYHLQLEIFNLFQLNKQKISKMLTYQVKYPQTPKYILIIEIVIRSITLNNEHYKLFNACQERLVLPPCSSGREYDSGEEIDQTFE